MDLELTGYEVLCILKERFNLEEATIEFDIDDDKRVKYVRLHVPYVARKKDGTAMRKMP